MEFWAEEIVILNHFSGLGKRQLRIKPQEFSNLVKSKIAELHVGEVTEAILLKEKMIRILRMVKDQVRTRRCKMFLNL